MRDGSVAVTRLVSLDDVGTLADLVRRDRDFMRPFEPVRAESYFTADGQEELVRSQLDEHRLGRVLPQVIVDRDGGVVGRVTLVCIERGAFQSGRLGYWVTRAANGRGLATAAVAAMVRAAFDDLGLHRVEAGTLVDNGRSQRVLERNGFVRFGLAPNYLNIAGQWQDHVLFQRLNPA